MLVKSFSLFRSIGFRKPRSFLSMMSTPSPLLDQVPDVEIDPEGRFKYVLIRVYAPTTRDGNEPSKMVVRGNARGAYHADIYDETMQTLVKLNLDSECVGGGRIEHHPAQKIIKIYGYSQGFGKADHEISSELVKKAFPDYNVTWSDEGY
uniref:Sex-regulated protein janus-A n=2 Tax=Lygus hesperus TaxID=30085 RepID=A0A0A9ZD48_LYGHE